MSYNILGINTSHNGSVCVLVNGNVDFFLEEERFSRLKLDDTPLNILNYISKKYIIDEIVITGLSHRHSSKYHIFFESYLTSLFPNTSINSQYHLHHLHHIFSAFPNSSFKKSLGVVVDGNGSHILSNQKLYVETESIFLLDLNRPPITLHTFIKALDSDTNQLTKTLNISSKVTLTKVYECITESLGFKWNEAGKTMGLSSYGKYNKNIPPLYLNQKGNPDIFEPIFGTPEAVLKNKYQFLLQNLETQQDLAYKAQQESQTEVGNLIEKYLKETGLKQVCCSGGYFLNCVANYYLIKRFPDVEFYFEPISNDAGLSIGAAKLAWHEKTQDTTIQSQKTLYYGPKYSKENLLKGIQKYLD